MTSFTKPQKKTVDDALGFLEKLIDCYKKLPKDKQTVPSERAKEIERIVKELKKLNAAGKIDFESKKYTVVASTDRNGIHLNDKFGNNYENDYKLHADYNLDDCKKGKFKDLWRLLEILIHENYHYEHHSGAWGSLKKVALVTIYGTVGNALEGIGSLFSSKPRLVRKHVGHEHETYGYCHHLLFWINSMISSVWIDQSVSDPCIPCAYEHIKESQKASARQNPNKWVP